MPQRGSESSPPWGQAARALGHPSRVAIFERLRTSQTAQTVAELAAVLPLHPNAIRAHLATLTAAGLLVQERAPSGGRGRPAWRYRLSPGAVQRWAGSGPQEQLSLMLLDLLQTKRSPLQVGRDAGVRLAAALTPPSDDPVDALVGVARRLGFEPEPLEHRAGLPDVVLRHCPFAVGAQRAPDVVCELHRGLAEGVCRHAGDTVKVADLVVRSPQRAGCRVVLQAVDAELATRRP